MPCIAAPTCTSGSTHVRLAHSHAPASGGRPRSSHAHTSPPMHPFAHTHPHARRVAPCCYMPHLAHSSPFSRSTPTTTPSTPPSTPSRARQRVRAQPPHELCYYDGASSIRPSANGRRRRRASASPSTCRARSSQPSRARHGQWLQHDRLRGGLLRPKMGSLVTITIVALVAP